MSMINKEDTLFDRDEKGEFIPQKIPLIDLDEEDKESLYITATPLTRGEVKKVYSEAIDDKTNKDQDIEIIKNHCLDPKYSDEDLIAIKPYMANAIVSAILGISGIARKSDYHIKEDNLKKK